MGGGAGAARRRRRGAALDRAGHVLEVALEAGEPRREPVTVGGQFAHLGGETLGFGAGFGRARSNLGHRAHGFWRYGDRRRRLADVEG